MQPPGNPVASGIDAPSAGGGGELLLVFSSGARPPASAFVDLAVAPGASRPFQVSARSVDEPAWLELLAAGLPFVVRGMAPGPTARVPDLRHAYDVSLAAAGQWEAIALTPGSSIPGGGRAMAVVRAQLGLAAELAALPNLTAIGWTPAGTLMSPDYFRRIIGGWLNGGAFPGLGLTALVHNGPSMISEGLTFFTGYEIAVAIAPGSSPADTAKLALRAMHQLVDAGADADDLPACIGLPDWRCEFASDRTLLRIGAG